MAWDTQYALDGFFMFGGPLNVTRYVIDPDDNKFGQSTDTYWVARFLLDEEIHVIARLNGLMKGPIVYHPVVYLLRRSSACVATQTVASPCRARPPNASRASIPGADIDASIPIWSLASWRGNFLNVTMVPDVRGAIPRVDIGQSTSRRRGSYQ